MIQDSKGALPLESPALQSGVGVAFGSRPLPRPTASQRLPESGLGTWRQDLLSAPARACAEPIGVAHEPAPPKPSVSTRPISQPPQRGADAACGAGYPECSARGQLTGVWFSRRRRWWRRLLRRLLLLARRWRRWSGA